MQKLTTKQPNLNVKFEKVNKLVQSQKIFLDLYSWANNRQPN